MSNHLEFPELLNWHQRRLGLSDAALARRSRLNKSTIGRLKRGERHPTWPDTVNKLIEGLTLDGADAENFKIAAMRHLGFVPVEAALPALQASAAASQRDVGVARVGVSDEQTCEVCGARAKTILGCASCDAPYCQHCLRTTRPFGVRCSSCGFPGFGGD